MARKKPARKQAQQRRRPLTNKNCFEKLWKWFLPNESIFSTIKFHGNSKWTPACLVWLALCWAWSPVRNLTDAFSESLSMCRKMFTCTPLSTYQGFMGALVRWTAKLLPLLQRLVQQRMEEMESKFWRIDDWAAFAFDGSRDTAPRTKSNEAAFCADNYGKGTTARYRKKKSKGMRRKRNEKNKRKPPNRRSGSR